MKRAKTRTVPYRRVREGKTNYKKRLKLLLSKKPRVVVRRSNKYIKGQFVEYNLSGDKVITFANSKELKNFGWKGGLNNLSSAYLTGLLLAKKSGSKNAIFDIGMQTSIKSTVLYAFAKGCIEGGLHIPCSENMFPAEEKIAGKNIADYAKLLKADKEKFEKQFGKISKNIDPEKIIEHFKEVKAKILGK